MSLLDQLWDDTVAGPRPENGLGKLRKHSTFSFRSNSGKEMGTDGRSNGGDSVDESSKVTRSIMIIKPRGGDGGGNGSPPISPAGSSTPPVSPFGGGRESTRFRRRFPSDAYGQQQQQQQQIRSPTAATSAIHGENDGFRCPTSPYDM